MTEYHSPTVVQPVIPEAAMTPLERLILGHVFDAEVLSGGVYLHTSRGPCEVVTLPARDLMAAFMASDAETGCIMPLCAELLLDASDARSGTVDLDLTIPGRGWDNILQDIVRRSATLEEVTVTTAFTATRMRPDGFGGSIMLITADAIRYASTESMLERLRDEAAKPPAAIPA